MLGAGSSQALIVTFTPTDTADYNDATASVHDQRPEGDAGDHLERPGRHHLRDGASGDAVERHGAGGRQLRVLACGGDGAGRGQQQTLNATFTPTDTADYNDATASVLINVQKATPVITWSNPADITYGTALIGDAVERHDAGGRAASCTRLWRGRCWVRVCSRR